MRRETNNINIKIMISVIVPVYNSERYLHRCINSILSQSYKNIEIIIVDDGSTDKSSIICDDYAKQDGRIKVFHQENQGVAAARQHGLELSSGDYIIHCDSDDWMDTCMLEELIYCASCKSADIVWTDFYKENIDGSNNYIKQDINNSDNIDVLIESLANARIMGALWNFLIKKDLIRDIKFDVGQSCCEDLIFILTVLVNNKTAKIIHIDKAFYHYFQNETSILHSLNPEKSYKIYQYTVKKLEEIGAISKQDSNGGYFYKRIVIGSLFKLKRYDDMKNTYPEIHRRIFQEMSFSTKFSLFSFCLLGYPRIGAFIECLKQFIKKLNI